MRTDQIFFEKLAVYEQEALRIMRERRELKEQKQWDKEQRKRCAFEHGDFLAWACSQCERETVD